MHDLYVLLQTAIGIGAIQTKETRDHWRSWIEGESSQRLDRYRWKMIGRDSLWRLWRAGLPRGEQLKSAAIERLETWASFRDPDCERSRRVARLALRLHDGLASQNLLGKVVAERSRAILHTAALLHAIGATSRGKKPNTRSYRMIRKLAPPIGWDPEDFKLATLVVRFHQGGLPAPSRKKLQDLTEEQRQLAMILAGILRLAVSFAVSHQTGILSIEISKSSQTLVIAATGYDKYGPLAQKLARARHLLEIAYDLPVVIGSK
jgi:exopolyphosphatase/pppGpp-phosphohydrolase